MDTFDTSIRTAPGPRDWVPAGSPSSGEPVVNQPRYQRGVSPLRGIGILALLAGCVSVFAAYRQLTDDPVLWFGVASSVAAVLNGILAIAYGPSIGLLNRVAGVMGLALGTLGTLVLAASLSGAFDGVIIVVGDQPLTAAEVAEYSAAVATERTELEAAATSASAAIAASFAASGTYPLDLVAAKGVFYAPGSEIELPASTRVSYSSDGSSYTLVLIGTALATQADSAHATVVTSLLSE